MTLAVHIGEAVCQAWIAAQRAEPQLDCSNDWGRDFAASADIPGNAVEFAHMVGDHSETLWKLLDFGRKNHALPPDHDMSEPTQDVGVPAHPTPLP
eukprot:8149417-Lingulodinium_polyedra.AAC.1